jgi:hypothetical protein
MDYAALKREMAGPAYAGQSDDAIADALNGEIADFRDVSAAEVRDLLMTRGVWGAVLRCSMSNGFDSAWEAARMMTDGLRDPPQIFRAADPGMREALKAGIGALAAAGVISAGDRNALAGLAHTTTSRATRLGWDRPLYPSDIAAARIYDND